MTSNSGKIENISEDDIEEIDQILKQSISLITRQTYKRGSTNLISAVITGLEYCSSRIYKYLQPLSIFEKISNFILVISTIILLKASRLLEFWTHISYKPLPNTIPVHPLIIRHLEPTFSPIFSFLAPHLVLIIQLVIISNFVSLMSSFAFYIVSKK